jgi:hypothetical protein
MWYEGWRDTSQKSNIGYAYSGTLSNYALSLSNSGLPNEVQVTYTLNGQAHGPTSSPYSEQVASGTSVSFDVSPKSYSSGGAIYTFDHWQNNAGQTVASPQTISAAETFTAIYTSAPIKVATPTFSPSAGTYSNAQTISISCVTNGATIRYTTDGTNPTSSSTVYSSPIPASSGTVTVKAKAFLPTMTDSDIATATYTISIPPSPERVSKPTFNPMQGTYYSPQAVVLSCPTLGAVIHYTTDNSEPTTSSSTYLFPIGVSSGTITIRAKAFSGILESDTAYASYTIKSPQSSAVILGVQALNSLESGVLDGARIVDLEVPNKKNGGSAVEVAKAVVTTSGMGVDGTVELKVAGEITKFALNSVLSKVQEYKESTWLYDYYKQTNLSPTINYWKENISSIDSVFQEKWTQDLNSVDFIKDMQTYHKFIQTTGTSFPDKIQAIVDAHTGRTFTIEMILLASGIAIAVVTAGTGTPFYLAVVITGEKAVIGSLARQIDHDEYAKNIVENSRYHEILALVYAEHIGSGLNYVAEKLMSNDKSFPQLLVEPFGSGVTRITNLYQKPIEAEIISSVTFKCLPDPVTKEYPTDILLTRHFEERIEEFSFPSKDSRLIMKPNVPQDIQNWIKDLETRGYKYAEYASASIRYGDGELQALKTIPLPSSVGPTLNIAGHSPINVIFTTQEGKRVGFNSATNDSINEIEGAIYSGPGTQPQLITIPYPKLGEGRIEVSGTGTGSYTITIELTNGTGSPISKEEWTGTTFLGKKEIKTIQILDNELHQTDSDINALKVVGIMAVIIVPVCIGTGVYFLRKMKGRKTEQVCS